MQFSKRTGKPIDTLQEQLIELPLAISDHEGNPLKGQKSYTLKNIEISLRFHPFSQMRSPDCIVMEGMFMINTTPLNSHKTLSDYCKFLFTRYILSQFKRGTNENHVIFDNPGQIKNTPKSFEQKRRDAKAIIVNDHCCDDLTSNTKSFPGKWRETFLNCRECKRNLVKFIGHYLLTNTGTYLQPHQTLFML